MIGTLFYDSAICPVGTIGKTLGTIKGTGKVRSRGSVKMLCQMPDMVGHQAKVAAHSVVNERCRTNDSSHQFHDHSIRTLCLPLDHNLAADGKQAPT